MRPVTASDSLLEAAALRMSQTWPERLDWAARQIDSTAAPDEAEFALWQAAVDPARTGQFEKRLDLGGLSREQALVALSPAGAVVAANPDWLPFLRDFRRACQSRGESQWSDMTVAWPEGAATVPFAHLLWRGVVDAWQSFEASHRDLVKGVSFGAADDLALALLSRLGELLGPTLLVEFTSTQTLGHRLLQRISVEPAEPTRTAYMRTCQELASGGLDTVLLEHPVLPRLLGTVIRQWHDATAEMLDRVQRHRGDLHREFGIESGAELTRAAVSAGDGHNDGRAVAVLSFGETKVIYKPRDCRLERLWESVLDVVNVHLDGPGLLAPRIVVAVDSTGAHYGFAEHITNLPAQSDDEVSRFYVNAGRTLAVLYALSGTDCHFENLIAHGDQLVLVDAESLFETRSARMQQGESDAHSDRDPVTVLQVGMLPGWVWMEGERVAVDISALGCQPGGGQRTTPRGWRSINTDAMTRGLTTVTVPHPVSLPTPPGVTPNLLAHVDEVTCGFVSGYRAVMAARDAGLLELLDDARHLFRRLIQRPTYVYAALLARSREPDALRSINAQGRVLEMLTRAYLMEGAEHVWPLLRAEQDAVARLDVPMFEAALDGSRTRCRGVEVLQWPGVDTMAVVRARLNRFDEADMRWQETLIHASFASRDFEATADIPLVEQAAAGPFTTPADLHDRCASCIRDNVVRSAGGATWMTLGLLPDGQKANVQEIGSGLYDGALGIAVYLHEAGDHELASAAIESLLRHLDPDEPAGTRRQLLGVGLGFSGAGGYLRGIRLLEEQHHLESAVADRAVSSIVRACALSSIQSDRRLDWIGGVAGLIGPLADEVIGGRLTDGDHDHAEQLLRAAAERLVSSQTAQGGWCTLPDSGPLTGLAHGASGIAAALVRAGLATDHPEFIESAIRGLEFEQECFDAEAGNWRDLRSSARGAFMLGWCAGAPGIALTRISLLRLLSDHPMAPAWHADLEIAAATTAAPGLLTRDHVCCGNLGRSAVLTEIGLRAGRADWINAAQVIMDAVAGRARAGLPLSFLGTGPGRVDTDPEAKDPLVVPGLMTGLAGSGLVLGGSDVWRRLLVP